MPSTLIAFLGACTLVAASPGPSTVLIIKQSLRSRRSGFLTVLGNETGVFVWGLVAAFGLTALLTASEVAYDVMRVVGAVVLVAFGVQALWQARRSRAGRPDEGWAGGAKRLGRLPRWAAAQPGQPQGGRLRHVLPAAVRAGRRPAPAHGGTSHAFRAVGEVGLAALWAVYEVGYYGLYVWFVGRMRTLLSRAGVRRRLEQVSGGVLLLLGVRLALEN
ncbi:threonine/homoserine/homoserine lactone efflux protein [Streptomyces canus]|nr:threonine/homoserine/homoserine lactone efflux protein [Streptomyces canus]